MQAGDLRWRLNQSFQTFAERFNRTYRNDIPDWYPFSDLNQVQQITEDWIEMYHHERPHNALRAMAPAEYKNAV